MDFKKGDVVIISKPRPVNAHLKGKRVGIIDPQAIGGTSVAASFIDKKDWQRYSGRAFYFNKDEVSLEVKKK